MEEYDTVISIVQKSECYGCHGCENVCPKECISMEADSEGFLYPQIDINKCINCNLCKKVCPTINIPQKEYKKSVAYACKNRNEEIRKASSSGGVFALLCEEVIRNDGVVFGSAFDKNFNVNHMYAETLEDCKKFRGSKYVQSKISNIYIKCKAFLEDGRVVLFSGTPCQVAGLDGFLPKKYSNLILVDIACHGVPSPLIYKKYLNDIKVKNQSEIKGLSFRDKSMGWTNYQVKVEFTNGKNIEQLGYENIYMKGFLKDIYLRPSCYQCKFKKPITSADITLADYWGVQSKHPQFDDNKGISLVLVNSKKGGAMFEIISCNMDVIKTNLEYAIKNNPCIAKPINYNKNRDRFFRILKKEEVDCAIIKCITPTFVQRLKGKTRAGLNKIKRVISK